MSAGFRSYVRTIRLQIYQLYVLSSLLLGACIGFLFVLLVVLSRLFGWRLEPSRPDLAQVHGEVQLVGFIGLFVLGLALRLVPRFSHTRLHSPELAAPTLALILAALLTRALFVIWLPEDLHSAAVFGVELALSLAAIFFTLMVWQTVLGSDDRSDASAWFFLGGSLLYLLQALLGLSVAFYELRDDTRVFSYLPHAGRIYALLGGFVVAFIAGVAGRALPVMLGLPQSQRMGRIVAAGLSADVSILAAALFYLEYRAYSTDAVRLANLALASFGVILLTIVWLTGIFRPRTDRLRPVSRPHLWLVRSAFAWVAFSGLLALYMGAAGLIDVEMPSFHAIDSLRHALGLGVATLFMAGMGFLILPEFANERQTGAAQAGRAYTLFVLLNVATFLRVTSSLIAPELDVDLRLVLQATAGGMAEIAVVIFAWAFLRMVRADRALA